MMARVKTSKNKTFFCSRRRLWPGPHLLSLNKESRRWYKHRDRPIQGRAKHVAYESYSEALIFHFLPFLPLQFVWVWWGPVTRKHNLCRFTGPAWRNTIDGDTGTRRTIIKIFFLLFGWELKRKERKITNTGDSQSLEESSSSRFSMIKSSF